MAKILEEMLNKVEVIISYNSSNKNVAIVDITYIQNYEFNHNLATKVHSLYANSFHKDKSNPNLKLALLYEFNYFSKISAYAIYIKRY